MFFSIFHIDLWLRVEGLGLIRRTDFLLTSALGRSDLGLALARHRDVEDAPTGKPNVSKVQQVRNFSQK